jgi:hypothetical protein
MGKFGGDWLGRFRLGGGGGRGDGEFHSGTGFSAGEGLGDGAGEDFGEVAGAMVSRPSASVQNGRRKTAGGKMAGSAWGVDRHLRNHRWGRWYPDECGSMSSVQPRMVADEHR